MPKLVNSVLSSQNILSPSKKRKSREAGLSAMKSIVRNHPYVSKREKKHSNQLGQRRINKILDAEVLEAKRQEQAAKEKSEAEARDEIKLIISECQKRILDISAIHGKEITLCKKNIEGLDF